MFPCHMWPCPARSNNFAAVNVVSQAIEKTLLGATSVWQRVRILTHSTGPILTIMRYLCVTECLPSWSAPAKLLMVGVQG